MRGSDRRSTQGSADREFAPLAPRPRASHGRREATWFTRTLLSDPEAPTLFTTRGPNGQQDDSDLNPLDEADWDADRQVWEAECEHSRSHAARHSLDETGLRHGTPCSLRWIYVHMIEEYARHNGHADLIREMLDGAVGW
jgi:Protein of unknown function (DUF664)